jgi:hypothetical protein
MTVHTHVEALTSMTIKELGYRLRNYGFVSPTGAPFDELLAPLLQERIDPTAARRLCNDLESTYQFHMLGGPLTNVVEWIELRRKVGAPSKKWC